MKRKGFTLVELLAVIAILAILVIIALPNVLKLYNNAKKNSFLTEAKTVYSEVSKKYIVESMKGNKLTYISSEDDTKLSMTGKDLQYCIKIDDSGKITSMKVGNGQYFILYDENKDITNYSLNDISEGVIENYGCIIDYSKIKLTLGNTETKILTMTLDTSNQDVGKITYKIFFRSTSKEVEVSTADYKNKYYMEYNDFTDMDQYNTIEVTAVINGKEFSKKSIGPACFVKGTKVKTEKGYKNIEDIKINDKIYSFNLDTNGLELKTVTNTIVSQTKETYIITIDNEEFEVTPRHELYIIDKGWIRTYDVKANDKMLDSNGKEVTIDKIVYKQYDKPIKTYNLSVEGNNNYFVTNIQVLVHNAMGSDTWFYEDTELLK